MNCCRPTLFDNDRISMDTNKITLPSAGLNSNTGTKQMELTNAYITFGSSFVNQGN